MEERKWEDLELDCLVNILERVGTESLLLNVPFVCKSWYKASLDPSCWGRIIFPDMVQSKPGFWRDDSFTQRLMDLYEIDGKKFSVTAFITSIVCRSCKKATMLVLPTACTVEALKYVADECPALKSLGLRCDFFHQQPHIIPELMGKWKNLEGLMLGRCNNLKEILANISLHCENIRDLRLDKAQIYKKETSAIVTLLPNIKQLLLRDAQIDGENLLTILQGCKELAHLDISGCVGCLWAGDKILELASHIHTFKYEGSGLYWGRRYKL